MLYIQPIWRHFGCPTSFKFPPFSVKSYHGGWDRPERTWGGTTCSLALQHKMTDFRFFDVFPTDLYTQQAGSKCIDIDMSFRCQNDIFSYGIRSRNESTESWHLKQPVKKAQQQNPPKVMCVTWKSPDGRQKARSGGSSSGSKFKDIWAPSRVFSKICIQMYTTCTCKSSISDLNLFHLKKPKVTTWQLVRKW